MKRSSQQIDKDRYQQIRAIFHEICGMPSAARECYLAANCSESELRREVQALLNQYDSPAVNLDEYAAGVGELLSESIDGEDPPAPALPSEVGPYHVESLLGSGGMGVVYLATQSSPNRQVAIKVIRPGYASPQMLRRFEHEASLLAQLQHPGIARLYDAGRTDDDSPYLAMEYVDGAPITQYCDDRQLSIDDRIHLFIAVADAIQHAHIRGIIHRDLKPGNVIVAVRDDQPWPRVIDFGVAKSLESAGVDQTLLTNPGVLLGTLAYMSPEQSHSSNDDVDIRSDIFSLGLILYELLAGCSPIDADTLRSMSLAEQGHVLWEQPRPQLSTRYRRITASDEPLASRIARQRDMDTRQLARCLHGELEWIVMKCLELERDRRYVSVASLIADLERYLRNEPVDARPPGRMYLVSKFAQRNRVAVLAGLVVTLALIVATIVSIRFAIKAAHAAEAALMARDAEAVQRRSLERREQELEKVVQFQTSMLGNLDAHAMGQSIRQMMHSRLDQTMRHAGRSSQEIEEALSAVAALWHSMSPTDLAKSLLEEHMLQRAVEAIDEQFADQPTVQAALLRTVSSVYANLGLREEGRPLIERAHSTQRSLLGPDHDETLKSLRQLISIHLMHHLLDDTERFSSEFLERTRQRFGESHEDTIEAMRLLAIVVSRQGRNDEARSSWHDVVDASRTFLGESHSTSLNAVGDFAQFLVGIGELQQAESLLRESLDKHDATDSISSIVVSRMLNDLGMIEFRLGLFEQAEHTLREAYERRKHSLGSDHPHTVISMTNLALVLRRLQQFDEAILLMRASIEIQARAYGEHDASVLGAMNTLAVFLLSQGRLDEAEPIALTVYERRRQLLGASHPETRRSLNTLGGVRQRQGRFDEAATIFRTLIDTALEDIDHPELQRLLLNLATTLRSQGEHENAAELFLRVHEVRQRDLGSDHPDTLNAMHGLALSLRSLGQTSDALAMAQEYALLVNDRFGESHAATVAARALVDELASEANAIAP